MHPRHPGGVTVTQSSGSEISVSCETVATQGSTLQTSSWSIDVRSNLVCNLWILLAGHVSTPVFMVERRQISYSGRKRTKRDPFLPQRCFRRDVKGGWCTAYCKRNRNLNAFEAYASLVSGCTGCTLHRWNGWKRCRTLHIHNCNHWNIPNTHTPCCQLASVILRVCSIAHRATGEIGLHQLHWPFYVTEPIPLHTKTNPVEQQFPLAIERVQSQTELLRRLWLKKVGKLPRHDDADE